MGRGGWYTWQSEEEKVGEAEMKTNACRLK